MFKNLSPTGSGISGHQSEIIELALTYGFGGMDLNVVDFATRARLKGLEYALRLVVSAKIQLGTFASPQSGIPTTRRSKKIWRSCRSMPRRRPRPVARWPWRP